MEEDFYDDEEFEGGEVVAIGDPEAPILPAEKNANEILAQVIMDGRRKLGTRNSYNRKIAVFLEWLLERHPTHYDETHSSDPYYPFQQKSSLNSWLRFRQLSIGRPRNRDQQRFLWSAVIAVL